MKSAADKAERRRKVDDIQIRITRLFFKTNVCGPAWEKLEALVTEWERLESYKPKSNRPLGAFLGQNVVSNITRRA